MSIRGYVLMIVGAYGCQKTPRNPWDRSDQAFVSRQIWVLGTKFGPALHL